MDNLSQADMENRLKSIEERLGRIETGRISDAIELHPALVLFLTLAAVVFGWLALGYPQHSYQFLFSGLLLLILYHRGLLRMARDFWRWPQVIANFLLLCLFFKFLIGGGIAYPFDWLKLPVITKTPPPVDPSWYSSFVPDYTVQWQGISKISSWSIDITKIQTIFFLATFAGALFRFEPFTSIAAMALLIASIPAFLNYNWDWAILFLISGGASLYIQSRTRAVSGS